jgi:hypothetical protein
MSKMYGKLRVVLNSKPTHLGNYLVCVCGSDSPSAIHPGRNSGNCAPLGYWYKDNGLFYVDLKSPEQWYDSVNRESIAHKRWGGLPTKASLRKFVLNYWNRRGEAQ